MSQSGANTAGGSVGPGPVFPNNFPITPFVVGPVGQAGYQTIQAGINAAHAFGAGLVYIQSGTYSENLTLQPNIVLAGDGQLATEIVGTHIPPLSGFGEYSNLRFTSAAVSFSTAASVNVPMFFKNCRFSCLNGYSFNLPNWLGTTTVTNCNCDGPEDGFFFTNTAATLIADSSTLGAGTTHILTPNFLTLRNTTVNCPVGTDLVDISGCILNRTFSTLNDFTIFNCTFNAALRCDDINSVGSITGCYLNSGSAAAYTMNANGTLITFSNNVIDSSASPCITGVGTTPIELTGNEFVTSSDVNPSLVLTYGVSLTGNSDLQGGSSIKTTTVTSGLSPYLVLFTNEFIACDPLGGAITINLPANPRAGTKVKVCDSTGHSPANNITISGNGNTISSPGGSLVASLTINIAFGLDNFYFNGTFWNSN